jgi:hypothetical protein
MLEANAVVEILLVEDNITDAELCIRALKTHNLASRLIWVKDGAEAITSAYPVAVVLYISVSKADFSIRDEWSDSLGSIVRAG